MLIRRLLLAALVLFAWLAYGNAWAAQTWPVRESFGFAPDSSTQLIQLCRPVRGCTDGKAFTGPNSCNYWNFPGNFPADPSFPGYCQPVPPVVVPPVTPPPVTPPPIKPPITVPVMARLQFCGLNRDALLKDIAIRLIPISNPDYIGYPGIAAWLCPGSMRPQFQYYNDEQLAQVVNAFANKRQFTTAEMQAWIDAQPVEHLTERQIAYKQAMYQPWTPHYEVTMDQVVYPVTATGNRSTVALAGAKVKAGEWCWSSVRPATSPSDWYSVKGRATRADGTLIDGQHYFAHCKLVNPFTQ